MGVEGAPEGLVELIARAPSHLAAEVPWAVPRGSTCLLGGSVWACACNPRPLIGTAQLFGEQPNLHIAEFSRNQPIL